MASGDPLRAPIRRFFAGKQKGQRKRAAQPRQGALHRFNRRSTAFHFLGDEMRNHLGVGFGRELGAFGFQLAPQLGKILDDAVMYDRKLFRRVRMGVVLGRPAVRRPAGVTDADRAGERFTHKPLL